MASETSREQRGRFSSFLNQELVGPIRETYLWWKNQAVGYKEKLMATRRTEAQPDPRMTPAQWEEQQRLINEGLARSRRNTHIELLIASGLLAGALVIGYLGLAGEQTGTSANIDSQGNNQPSITAPAPAEAVEVYTATATATATFTPLPTATFAPTETATAILIPTPEPPLTWTPIPAPRPTEMFTPTPNKQNQELLFPNELSGCANISDIDEVLALEKERISFEKNFPSVQQVVKIERYGAIVDYNTLLLFPSQSGFADSPIKPVTCSRMIVDGADVYVVGIAVRNRDGSTGFLHVMIGGTDADGVAIPVFVDLPEGIFWRATKVGVEETFGAIKDGIERIKLGYGVRNRAAFLALGLKFEVNYYDNHPELFAMMEDYFITGIVPAELESIAIPLYSVRK